MLRPDTSARLQGSFIYASMDQGVLAAEGGPTHYQVATMSWLMSDDSHMKGLFPLVFSRTSCPVSSSVLSISDSGYQKAQVPLGLCLLVIFTSSALFTIADSCSSDRRSDFPLASTSVWTENKHLTVTCTLKVAITKGPQMKICF